MGAERADDRRRDRPAGQARRGDLVGEVSPVVGGVPGLVDDLGDGGAGGGLVDEVLAGGEGGDEGLQGEVVDGAGVAAPGGVDEVHGVLGEQAGRAVRRG